MEHMGPVRHQTAQVRGGDRCFDELKRRLASERGKIVLLDRARVVVRKAVDPDDVGAVGHEPLRERRPDEPGDAGHQRLHHSNACLARAGSRAGLPLRSSDA